MRAIDQTNQPAKPPLFIEGWDFLKTIEKRDQDFVIKM